MALIEIEAEMYRFAFQELGLAGQLRF